MQLRGTNKGNSRDGNGTSYSSVDKYDVPFCSPFSWTPYASSGSRPVGVGIGRDASVRTTRRARLLPLAAL